MRGAGEREIIEECSEKFLDYLFTVGRRGADKLRAAIAGRRAPAQLVDIATQIARGTQRESGSAQQAVGGGQPAGEAGISLPPSGVTTRP